MTNARTLTAIAALLLLLPISAPARTNPDEIAVQAQSLYQQGEYAAAYKKFLKAGKKGHRYSSYRVSYMKLTGQGTSKDVVESVAWAVLAAHGETGELSEYKNAVAALIPQDQRKKAQKKADYYMRRWGEAEENRARNSVRECTGSRLSRNCSGASGSATEWIRWSSSESDEDEVLKHIEELDRAIVQASGIRSLPPAES